MNHTHNINISLYHEQLSSHCIYMYQSLLWSILPPSHHPQWGYRQTQQFSSYGFCLVCVLMPAKKREGKIIHIIVFMISGWDSECVT